MYLKSRNIFIQTLFSKVFTDIPATMEAGTMVEIPIISFFNTFPKAGMAGLASRTFTLKWTNGCNEEIMDR